MSKMMMDRAVAEQALEALEYEADRLNDDAYKKERDALRAALAESEKLSEPVAWMHTNGVGHVYFRKKPQDRVFNPRPVYLKDK